MAAWAEILSCCGSSSTMFLGSTWKGLEKANRSHVVSSNIPSNNLHNPINVKVMEKIQNIVSIQLLHLLFFSVSYTVILKWISYIDSWSDKEVTVAISQSQRWQNTEMAIFTVFWHSMDMKLIKTNKTNQIAKCIPKFEIYRAKTQTLFVLFKL